MSSVLLHSERINELTDIQAPYQLPAPSALGATAHDEDDGDDLHDARLLLDLVPLRISDRIATQATTLSEQSTYSSPITGTEHGWS